MNRYDEVLETLKKYTIADGIQHIVVNPECSVGSWVHDSRTGKKYLDCMSQFASQPLGWNHPGFDHCAEKFKDVLKVKIANSDMYVPEYAEFVQAFADVTPDFKHYFFIDGGTLGVENALKCAFDWKMKKLGWRRDSDANRLDVIHLEHAFHGRSGYTMSLTNTKPVKTWGYPKFNWTRLYNPAYNGEKHKHMPVEEREAKSLAQAKHALEGGNVAAVILEPIQGEGGDIHFRPEYLQALRKLATDYDAMFILDEVQTGVGLTGKMWCYEHFDIKPDMMAFGKKAQTCGFCATDKVEENHQHVFNQSGRINSTWGGNIVDMVRFCIIIEVIKKENLVENAQQVGDFLFHQLRMAGEEGKAPIKNVRGRGLMIAFDPIGDRDEAFNKLSENMLCLKSGGHSIRLRPPLTFSISDASAAVDFIRRLL